MQTEKFWCVAARRERNARRITGFNSFMDTIMRGRIPNSGIVIKILCVVQTTEQSLKSNGIYPLIIRIPIISIQVPRPLFYWWN